ncbi:tRNA lysidine(34) synthetase TilS [Blattabacterium cuenoti]|uniref:tRNA lysidine(34) synthetase TilS n=1 Tax=Blattabacterium cuenoti TaxID=1653831 RepID=UPI00163C9D2F|nr:tRNA lysidine(34) synthetase TilS [Blattabacterium cuenoti]
MNNNFFNKKKFFIDLKNLLSDDNKKKLGISVSGGLDSMVLLNLLIETSNDIEVIHCNFNLRGDESNEDEIFVKDFCQKKNIICHVKKFNTVEVAKKKKISIQMSARELRYNWFNELLEKEFYEYILLGHHFNDSIETFFINLFRGTGIKGLLGIPKKNKRFLRPLSDFSKKNIFFYAKNNDITWRTDSSNQNSKYTRNKIRKTLHFISNYFPFFFKGLKKTMNFLHEENELIEKNIDEKKNEITINKKFNPFFWKIDTKKVKNLYPLSFYLFKLFYPYGFYDIKSLINLLYTKSGKKLISAKYNVLKNRNYWIMINNYSSIKDERIFFIKNFNNVNHINLPIKIKFDIIKNYKKEHLEFNKNIFFIDFQKIKLPLLLRTWRYGDFFYPLNMNGKKKISKYYKDEKFSILKKNNTWIFINENNHIILVGNRMDNRFKITIETNKILIIQFNFN